MQRHRLSFLSLCLALLVCTLGGCRGLYYDFWETFGKEKRDLLSDQIDRTNHKQTEVREEFTDTLERIRHQYKFDAGELEKTYDKVAYDFERSNQKAAQLRKEIKELKTVAADLFREWRVEAATIETRALRLDSLNKLAASQKRFAALVPSMDRMEAKLERVLAKMRDYKLYLKHNLNTRAVASLRGEMLGIEKEIHTLIADINRSIGEVDAFAKTLKN